MAIQIVENCKNILTATYHVHEEKAERHPDIVEALLEERLYLESLVVDAAAERHLQEKDDRPSLEECFSDAELEQMKVATNHIAAKRGALADPARQAKHRAPKLSSLQAATCTTGASMKRLGRGSQTKQNADRQADERTARLDKEAYRASLEDHGNGQAAYWLDQFNPSEARFLIHGDPRVGLGPCVVDPAAYLEYRSTLYCLRVNGGKRC